MLTHKEIECTTDYLTMILNAPRGVTRTAGANAYATKFATSPTITTSEIIHTTRDILQTVSEERKSMVNHVSSHWLRVANSGYKITHKTTF